MPFFFFSLSLRSFFPPALPEGTPSLDTGLCFLTRQENLDEEASIIADPGFVWPKDFVAWEPLSCKEYKITNMTLGNKVSMYIG